MILKFSPKKKLTFRFSSQKFSPEFSSNSIYDMRAVPTVPA